MKTSKKYNNKEIMRRAWELRRTFGLTMGEAMKAAWAEAKAEAGVSEMDSTIQRLFDAKAELDEAKANYDAIAAEVEGVCLLAPDCTISGYGWKARFKSFCPCHRKPPYSFEYGGFSLRRAVRRNEIIP